MVVDNKGAAIFGEDTRTVSRQIGMIQGALADRTDGLVSDEQVKLARRFGEMTLAMIAGNNKGAASLWQGIQEQVSEKEPG